MRRSNAGPAGDRGIIREQRRAVVTQRGGNIQIRIIDADIDVSELVGGGGRNVQLESIAHGQADPGRRRRDWIVGGRGIGPTEADAGSEWNGLSAPIWVKFPIVPFL